MSLISVEQAAGLLCVSRATAYRMAIAGKEIGKARRTPEIELDLEAQIAGLLGRAARRDQLRAGHRRRVSTAAHSDVRHLIP
jgi:hypothetical protein